MELVYKARYFDGYSGKPQQVDVLWHDDVWVIQFLNDAGELIKTTWQKQHVVEHELKNGLLSLRYGDVFPAQQLDITDQDFIKRYKQAYPRTFAQRLNMTAAGVVATSLLLLLLVLWASYVWLLPAIATYGAKVFPKDYEIELGQKLYASVLEGEQIDSSKTIAINQFFNQLKIEKSYPAKITVVKSNITNAFAMPGGGIVVYDAILNNMKSPEQLAALLAHEYSHVELKHATRNLFRTLSGYLFLSIVFGDMSGVGGILIENAHQLRNLSYSRALETEADNSGLKVLKENKLNPKGMIDLFELLKKESDGAQVNELISTHPDLNNRIQNVETFIQEHPYNSVSNDSLNHYFNQIKNNWNE
ncbi:MAG: M48 family metallopeptidase [Bacteroidia bacterium]